MITYVISVLELRSIIHMQALAFTSQWQCCFIRINSVGTHLFMAGPKSFHFSQGPQHQKWHYLSSLQTVSSGIMHHVCSWKPHCVLLGEWEQEAKNKLAWWEWLWSCKYRESSLPTKVASFWCGKNNDVGEILGLMRKKTGLTGCYGSRVWILDFISGGSVLGGGENLGMWVLSRRNGLLEADFEG